MPETRNNSNSEILASVVQQTQQLAQSVADLNARTPTLENLRVEDSARQDAKYDRIMALLEGMDRRAGKQAEQLQGESSSAGLLPTPTTHSTQIDMPRQQQVMVATGDSDGSSLMKPVRNDVPTFTGEAMEGWLFQMTLATFHLGGEALQWFQWLHTTQQVRDWSRFVTDVKRRFGPSVYYSAEALINKLNQTSNVASYITEFESLSTRTPGLTHDNLLHRFVAGLKDEIHNEIVLLCPNNLQAAMGMARVAEQKVHSGKWHVSRPPDARSSFSQQGVLAEPNPEHIPQVASSALPVTRLTQAEMAARRERGLCFNCDERFMPGHKCRPKFQCLILEDEKPSASDEEVLQTEEASHEIVPAISYHAMQGCPVPRTISLAAGLAGRQVMVLVDGGSTHNFLQSRVAKSAGLVVEAARHLSVTVGNGDELRCEGVCRGVRLLLGGNEFIVDFHLLPIYGVDAVLGAQWLAEVRPVVFDYKELWLSLEIEGQTLVLHGQEHRGQLASLTLGQLRRARPKDAVMTMFHMTVAMVEQPESVDGPKLPTSPGELTSQQQSDLLVVLHEYAGVFALPKGLPPFALVDWPACFVDNHSLLVLGKVLATRVTLYGNHDVPQLKVKWKGHGDEDATWEDQDSMLLDYPQFNLEDKVPFGGGDE